MLTCVRRACCAVCATLHVNLCPIWLVLLLGDTRLHKHRSDIAGTDRVELAVSPNQFVRKRIGRIIRAFTSNSARQFARATARQTGAQHGRDKNEYT